MYFRETTSVKAQPLVSDDVVIAADVVNSSLRRQLVGDGVVFTGINTWRGVTRRKPILDGRSYLRIGSILTGKMVIYPIADDVDDAGNQLINWLCEIQQDVRERNDWNKPGRIEDFFPIYERWTLDWIDIPALISSTDT